MEPTVVTVQVQHTKSDPEDDWYYEYLCAACVALRDNCSLEVAMMTIHKSHHGWARRMERVNLYKFATSKHHGRVSFYLRQGFEKKQS